MECIKCGNPISMTDKYFALSDVISHNDPRDFFLCEECAELVTPMELYMSGKIRMANNDDESIEVDAVVVETTVEHENEMSRYARQGDTKEEILMKYPDMDEYWDAEVEGK